MRHLVFFGGARHDGRLVYARSVIYAADQIIPEFFLAVICAEAGVAISALAEAGIPVDRIRWEFIPC